MSANFRVEKVEKEQSALILEKNRTMKSNNAAYIDSSVDPSQQFVRLFKRNQCLREQWKYWNSLSNLRRRWPTLSEIHKVI